MSGKFLYSYSKRALRDIAKIYRYIARDNPAAAAQFTARLEAKISTMATAGVAGVARDRLAEGLRAVTIGDRCIYFRVDGNELKVLRVLHTRQNISVEMFSPTED